MDGGKLGADASIEDRRQRGENQWREKLLTMSRVLETEEANLETEFINALELLKNPEKPQPNEIVLKYRDGQHTPEAIHQNLQLSEGQIMAGIEWGKKYYFDWATYTIEERKKFLEASFNKRRQDLDYKKNLVERALHYNQTSTEERRIYRELYEKVFTNKKVEVWDQASGILAEKLVYGFLKRVSTDTSGLFSVESVVPQLDVEGKVDFIIRHATQPTATEGVDIRTHSADSSNSSVQKFGIQFTLNNRAVNFKQRQIGYTEGARDQTVDKVLVVSVPLEELQETVRDWSKQNMLSSPDQLLSTNIQRLIINRILNRILSAEELRKLHENLKF